MNIEKNYKSFKDAVSDVLKPGQRYSSEIIKLSDDDENGGISHLNSSFGETKIIIVKTFLQPAVVEIFNRAGSVDKVKIGNDNCIVLEIASGEDWGLALRKGAIECFVFQAESKA